MSLRAQERNKMDIRIRRNIKRLNFKFDDIDRPYFATQTIKESWILEHFGANTVSGTFNEDSSLQARIHYPVDESNILEIKSTQAFVINVNGEDRIYMVNSVYVSNSKTLTFELVLDVIMTYLLSYKTSMAYVERQHRERFIGKADDMALYNAEGHDQTKPMLDVLGGIKAGDSPLLQNSPYYEAFRYELRGDNGVMPLWAYAVLSASDQDRKTGVFTEGDVLTGSFMIAPVAFKTSQPFKIATQLDGSAPEDSTIPNGNLYGRLAVNPAVIGIYVSPTPLLFGAYTGETTYFTSNLIVGTFNRVDLGENGKLITFAKQGAGVVTTQNFVASIDLGDEFISNEHYPLGEPKLFTNEFAEIEFMLFNGDVKTIDIKPYIKFTDKTVKTIDISVSVDWNVTPKGITATVHPQVLNRGFEGYRRGLMTTVSLIATDMLTTFTDEAVKFSVEHMEAYEQGKKASIDKAILGSVGSLLSGGTKMAAGFMSGNAGAAAGGMVEAEMGIASSITNGVNDVAMMRAQRNDLAHKPNELKSFTQTFADMTAFYYSSNLGTEPEDDVTRYSLVMLLKRPFKRERVAYGTYYTLFGYRTSELKKMSYQDFMTRKYYTYTQLIDGGKTFSLMSAPLPVVLELGRRFEAGVRLWDISNGEVNDFSKDNKELPGRRHLYV